MKESKFYLCLTYNEKQLIVKSLINQKNKMTRAGKFTDAIDDVLYKTLGAKRKKIKVQYV